tara:strand:- start:4832 stop:5395 length:564 start_codon:yes stop_codon:yes gene_type:complete
MSDLTITHAGSTVTQSRPGMGSNSERLNQMIVKVIDVTLTTAVGTHGDNTVISESIEIPNAVSEKGGSAIIQSIYLQNTDNDVESPALELIFAAKTTTIASGGIGTAITAGDDGMVVAKIQGSTTVSNWSTFKPSSNEFAVKSNIGLVVRAESDTRSIYVHTINRSGDDFTPSDTGKLTARIGIVQS